MVNIIVERVVDDRLYVLQSIYGLCGVSRGWRRGVVASVVRRMNEVTVHWARLVLGWVTVFGRVYHGM